MINKGLFIVLEGIDGCGKTTQVNLLYKRLLESKWADRGIHIASHFTYSPFSRKMKELLCSGVYDLDATEEVFLVMAARYGLGNLVREWIDQGSIVIADRLLASTLTYQAKTKNGEDSPRMKEWILELHKEVFSTPIDLNILLEIEPELAIKRSANGREELDSFDKGEVKCLTQIASNFKKATYISSEYSLYVNGEMSIEEVSDYIWNSIQELLEERFKNAYVCSGH